MESRGKNGKFETPPVAPPVSVAGATKQPYVAQRPPAACPIQYHHHNLPTNEYKWECQRKENMDKIVPKLEILALGAFWVL